MEALGATEIKAAITDVMETAVAALHPPHGPLAPAFCCVRHLACIIRTQSPYRSSRCYLIFIGLSVS